MDTYILSQPTRSGNSYWLSNHKNLCGLAHPQLMNPASQDEYYYRKRQYLIKHMVANDYVEQHSARLTADMIRNKVVNLKQLVFEVTDSCNLRCKYCGYGDLYEGYDIRRNSKMTREQVQPLFDYLVGLWTQMPSDSYNDGTKISFYGGEPLLNMPFIKSAVSFFKNLSIHGKQFSFSMTSNAILLDRHIDFLAENEFSLLISLDH
ncbi:MAG TPA: hypothetical protein DHW31_02300 [Bacteroides graminisolvens]|mgnify:CR=1 FL=1|uniref:Radical SAM core domain-containing protein n=1 Tax=Bacteroides graminisolvens TaxID=477666 RepID=A0A3D2SFD0_9BACE|nr:hypothetical protein [Bacteroides graminisolvens]